MSNTPKDALSLDVTPVNLNGRLTHRVFAKSGNAVFHNDTFDLGSAEKRSKFIRRLAERAQNEGREVNESECEKALLDLAYQSSLGLQEGQTESDGIQAEPEELLNAFGIDVLGEQEDQSIVLWCRNTKKRWVVKDPGRWSAQQMRQALGKSGDRLLWLSEDPPPDGMYTTMDLQRAVALAAADAPRISGGKMIGQGIWKRGREFLVVNGAKANVFRVSKRFRISRPRFKSEILDFDDSKTWINHAVLLNTAKKMTKRKATKAVRRIEELLLQWNWTHKWDHRILSLLIPATFIQTCWSWRPLVSIISPSDSGKSTLLGDLLLPLLGDWTIYADRSSEAGLRQRIRHHAAPLLIDEFDKYKQRQQVLELFRTSSRGGKILRGTANQEGQEFGVKHIPWFAAVESGDIWGQDRNRFIRFELLPPEHRGRLSLPTATELRRNGQELVAVALWAAPAAIELADHIKGTQIDGVHGRLVESFSVPAALDAVVCQGHDATAEQATKALRAFLRNRSAVEDQGEADEIRLLRDIFSASVRIQIPNGDRKESVMRTIGQVLHGWKGGVPNSDVLLADEFEAKGLRVISRQSLLSYSLFIVHEVVRGTLLRGTRWEGTCIDQIRTRLPGAERCQQRCGGQRPWGVALPWPECLESIGGQDDEQDSATS